MTVILTDEQYGALMWAMRRIAGVTKIRADGKRYSVLTRTDVELMAREACDKMGWTYGREMLEDYLQMFGPDDRPPLPKLSPAEQRKAHKHRHIFHSEREESDNPQNS